MMNSFQTLLHFDFDCNFDFKHSFPTPAPTPRMLDVLGGSDSSGGEGQATGVMLDGAGLVKSFNASAAGAAAALVNHPCSE